MARKFTQNDLSDLTDASNSYLDESGAIQTFQKVEVPFNYKRGNPGPLDKSSTWTSLSAAEKYAAEDPTSYVGQLITVNDGTGVSAYVIDNEDGDLKSLATGGSADEILQKLNDEIARAEGAEKYISSEVSTLVETTLPLSVSNLESNLSIALTPTAGSGDVLSTYTITQGTTTVGTIDIPKDKVIESASVVKFDTDEEAQRETGDPTATKGTYLKLVIQNQQKAVFIKVPELASVYKGYDSDTIKLDVVQTSGEEYTISAIVNEKSIGFNHLTDDLSAYIKTVVDREAADREAIEILSGDEDTEGSVAKALKDAKDYTDAAVKDLSVELSTGLSVEIDRAKAAEEANAAAIEAESQRATQAENEIATDLTEEVTRAKEAEEANAAAIEAEETRATQKEGELAQAISDEETRATAAEAANTALIEAEETRATAAEAANTALIEAEATRADAAEKANAAAIETEKTRAEAQEGVISGNVIAETARAIGAESVLQTNIDTLSTTVNAKIDAAIEAGAASDAALGVRIDANKLSIETETARALTAEAALDAKITAETTAREEAIEDLSVELKGDIQDIKDNYALSTDVETISASLFEKIETDAAAAAEAGQISAQAVRDDLEANYVPYSVVNSTKEKILAGNKIATLADIAGLSGVIHLRGIAPAVPANPKTEKPDTKWYNDGNDPVEGDIIVVGTKEYMFTGTFGQDDADWKLLGDEGTYATKQELADEAEARDDADQFLSGKIDTVSADLDELEAKTSDYSNDWKASVDLSAAALCAYAEDLSDAIGAEAERAAEVEEDLSTAIDNRIKVQNVDDDAAVSSDLTIKEISEEEYMAKVAAGESLISTGILYVMKPEGTYAFNAYGKQIVNVADPTADQHAATKKYVDAEVKKVADNALSAIEINGLEFEIVNNRATIEISSINGGNAEITAA